MRGETVQHMKKIDHMNLAKFWMEEAGTFLPQDCQEAFIYGNIEPDINYVTYLHGFLHHHPFRGHNFTNITPTLLKMLEQDAGKLLTVRQCYRLGKCCHYAADIFTFPHNEEFPGNMRDHIRYELDLHAHWGEVLRGYQPCLHSSPLNGKELGEAILALHSEYVCQQGGPAVDCEYILTATKLLLEACLLPIHQEVTYEDINHYGLLLPHN